jgi:uncharacterized membrane protein
MLETDKQQYGVSRLVAFSDGVFGFAITLLITTIPLSLEGLPPSANEEQIRQYLLSLWPHLYAYILSFYIIGNYWVIHHRLFQSIIKFDAPLLWLNLTLLLFIAFLPFPTSLLGQYGHSSIITALYATTQMLITLAYLAITWYTHSHHRLILPSLDQKTTRRAELRGLIPLTIFALSIGLSFLSPSLAQLAWISIFFIRPVILSRDRLQVQ